MPPPPALLSADPAGPTTWHGTARGAGWSPLVRLRSAPSGMPCAFVHPAGGNVLCYRHLAQALRRPFYGLQARGAWTEQGPLDDVAAMASLYLRALRQALPAGPCLLGGWSAGGMIAFEMARQAERAGHRVAHVVMLDTPAPLQHEPVDEHELLLWFLQDLDIGFDAANVERLRARGSLAEALALLGDGGRMRGFHAPALQRAFDVFRATTRAIRSYRPTPIDADLLVLKAEDGSMSELVGHPAAGKADWGWQAFTRGRAIGRGVPGNHYSLLAPCHLPDLAAQIQAFAPAAP